MTTPNRSKVGDRVTCNGYPGTVTRTKDSPDSAWMGNMVEVRVGAGLICTADYLPDVVPIDKAAP